MTESVPGFTGPDGYADVAVIVVTYNNADDVDPLVASLREQLDGSSIRVLVADNTSADDTLERLRRHPDVIVIPTGGNLGYAGGINVARHAVGEVGAVLVLNPDLSLAPGAIAALRTRLAQPEVGAVVPRLLEADGSVYTSLRHEPTLLRAVGDALLGAKVARSSALTEIELDPAAYETAHRIDWATGAAIMVDAALERRIGQWDEQFFLYSEEIDYARRLRELGVELWFEPAATMEHRRGGSGASDELEALMAVNRVRYQEKWHGRIRTAPYRGVVVLASALRSNQSRHRAALGYLVDRDRWDQLPAAVPAPSAESPTAVPRATTGAIIIPAHNEASVIGRTLAPLAPLVERGIEVLVAPNGCTDDTAERAAAVPGVRVVDVPVASKVAALNAADDVATAFPRLYLDADITVTPEAVDAVFAALARPGILAARPAFRYDTTDADPAIRAYYRARSRIPAMSEHLWGAGAYALNEAGHERLGRFPDLTGDDLYVDQLFERHEVAVVDTTPTQVLVPRTSEALLKTLRRVYGGNSAVARSNGHQVADSDPAGGLKPLLRGVDGPASLADAAVYAGFAVTARLAARRRTAVWHRDETNRVAPVPGEDAGAVPPGPAAAVDHVVLTRFNVPSAGVESLIRAKEGWLRGRVALFETYTVPAMERQDTAYTWLVFFDPESPTWFKEWLQPFADRGLFVPVFRESVSHEELLADIREHTPRRADVVITTNLDNDDGLAHDFLSLIQAAPVRALPSAVYLVDGLIVREGEVFARADEHNAFCSVRESWEGDLRTCWADWHNRLGLHMPVVEQRGEPAWLQVVHGSNVSNRVNGQRVSPEAHRARFAPALDDAPTPDRWSIARDRFVDRPQRLLRESARAGAKKVVLTLGGKGGLDRLKAVLGSARRTPQ